MCPVQAGYIFAADVVTCTESYLSRKPPTLSKVLYIRSVEHGERPCNTARQSECVQVAIFFIIYVNKGEVAGLNIVNY